MDPVTVICESLSGLCSFIDQQLDRFSGTFAQNTMWALLIGSLFFARRIARRIVEWRDRWRNRKIDGSPATGVIGRHRTDFRVLNWFSDPRLAPRYENVAITVIERDMIDADGASIGRDIADRVGEASEQWRDRLDAAKAAIEYDGIVFHTRRLDFDREDHNGIERNILSIDLAPRRYSVHRARMDFVRSLDPQVRRDMQESFVFEPSAFTPLAGAIAVNVLIVSKKGNLLFARRGPRNAAAGGQMTCGVDEMLNTEDCTGSMIHLRNPVTRALREELGIRGNVNSAIDVGAIISKVSPVVSRVLRMSSFDFGIGVGIDARTFDRLRSLNKIEDFEHRWLSEVFSEENIVGTVATGGNDDPIEINHVEFLPLDPEKLGKTFRKDPDRFDSSAFMMAATALNTLDGLPLWSIAKAFR